MKIPFFRPWISAQDKKAVLQTLNQRWLTNGPQLKNFETKFSRYLKTTYSFGVSNATHALHLSLRSIGIGTGDEVIVPTMTFSATAEAVLYCGAKPILVDVDYDTFNLDPKSINKHITSKTKAIIPVHYGGQSCDMTEIFSIAKKYKLKVIEDCAHALGSKYKKFFCGTLGSVGCFSFYPTKIITTGEGGMVVTKDPKIAKKINSLRSHAMSISASQREKQTTWKYDVLDLGYNYRLDEIRSSLGNSQLSRINEINLKRQKIAKYYDEKLSKIKGIILPVKKSNRNHIFHLYTIKITNDYSMSRDQTFKKLSEKGVGTSVQYMPLHKLTLYKKLKLSKNTLPIANKLQKEILSLPIFPTMTKKELNYIISILQE